MKNKKKMKSFCFGPVTYDGVLSKAKTFDTTKASQQSDFRKKILKQKLDYCAEYFYKTVINCISKTIFTSDLK